MGISTIASDALVSGKTVLNTVVRSSAAAAEGDGHGSGGFTGSELILMLLTLSVILSVVNYHYFKIPSAIFIAMGSIVFSVFIGVFSIIPGVETSLMVLVKFLEDSLENLVLYNMLGFLLFAAALEVKWRYLERIWTTVIALSVFATAISTLTVSVLTYLLMQTIAPMEFSYCLLFGSIVSPTDPVTVISIVHSKPHLLPKSTEYFITGESLLNDAVGVILYGIFRDIVKTPHMDRAEVVVLLLKSVVKECIMGVLVGVVLAWIAYSAMKSVKDPLLKVMITFVLVGNINMVCTHIHASIPLASVFAGLFVGNYGVEFALEEKHRELFQEVWKLTDETLNSLLFLMIGATELLWNPQALGFFLGLRVVVSIICISLVARAISVSLPLATIHALEWFTGRRFRHPAVEYRGGTIAVLTWGGMRGGISIALAFGIPDPFLEHSVPGHMTHGQLIFFMTFTLVVFSIIVQGLAFEPVVRAITRVGHVIMPESGGIGTFKSNFGLTAAKSHERIELPDPTFDPGFGQPWNSNEGSSIIPFSSEGSSDAPVQLPDRPVPKAGRKFALNPKPRTRAARQQESNTFSNLRPLEEPITVENFLAKFFQPRRSTDDERNHPLRRSRTAPNDGLSLRTPRNPEGSQDDLSSTLSSALAGRGRRR